MRTGRSRPSAPAAAMWLAKRRRRNARLGPGRQPASTQNMPTTVVRPGERERPALWSDVARTRDIAVAGWLSSLGTGRGVGGQPPARRGPRLAARPAPHRTGTPPRQTGASRTLSQGPRGNWTCTTHPYPSLPDERRRRGSQRATGPRHRPTAGETDPKPNRPLNRDQRVDVLGTSLRLS